MKILIVDPEQEPRTAEIDDTLDAMQAVVGGTIQALYPFDDTVALICNDDGKLLNLPLNRELRDADGDCYDIVCGTFFLVGVPPNSDHFESLTEKQIARYSSYYAVPRLFLQMNGKIVILPCK